jgi:integrase
MNEVEAVKNKEDLITIHNLLKKHGSQDFADIWRLGINVALRISDLLSIKAENIDLVRRELEIIEGKTKKRRLIRLNDIAMEIIQRRQEASSGHKYLFQSTGHRGRSLDKPLNRSTVARRFKEIGLIVGVKLGTHSMRKTRGYMMYQAGVSIEQIARVLNHSSPSVTMAYIGLTREETMRTYEKFEL